MWTTVAQWLESIFRGDSMQFLNSALHVCLQKKEPSWLLRNSRPIVIEPIPRRLAAGVMFRRVLCRAELSGWIDPWCFSYRKEFSPLLLGIFVRWTLAFWVLVYTEAWVIDWDESNAFCNLCRDDLPQLFHDTPFPVGEWTKVFFDSLWLYVSTPFGLTRPYRMKQGGVQGDSLGVLQYLLVRLIRSKALRQLIEGPPHPTLHQHPVPEVMFSDDSRLFGLTARDLAQTLNHQADLATKAGASVNVAKLKAFRIQLGCSGLIYAQGEVSSKLGALMTESSGLRVVGVPCVMGELPTLEVKKLETALNICLARIRHFSPSCILALRVILTFAVSSADYRLGVVPVPRDLLSRSQTLVHQTARAALRVPSWFPSFWLTTPMPYGGLGFPRLATRLALRFVLNTVLAICSRSIYTSSLLQGLVGSGLWAAAPWSDNNALCNVLADHQLRLLTFPCAELCDLPLNGEWVRQPSGAPVIVVSDGSCEGSCVGFSAIIYDAHGMLGKFWGGARLADPSSWVAEWFGKILAVNRLSFFDPCDVLLLADNTSVILDWHNIRSSGSHIVDCCVRYFWDFTKQWRVEEGFIPAAHDTLWSNTVSEYQKMADMLANEGRRCTPTQNGLPFLNVLRLKAVLLSRELVCIKPAVVLDSLYDVLTSVSPSSPPCPLSAAFGWEDAVSTCSVGNGALRHALWIRSAPLFHSGPDRPYCPFCSLLVQDWASHFNSGCSRLFVGCLVSFRRAVALTCDTNWSLIWRGPWQVLASHKDRGTMLISLVDDFLTIQGDSSEGVASVFLTRSGLVRLPMESPHIPSSWCSGLVANYLKALESCLLSADMGVLLLDAEGTHPTPTYPAGIEILATLVSILSGAVSGDSTCLSPPMWVQPPSHSRIWVSTSPVVNPPFDVLVIYVRQGSFDFPLGQSSVCVGGYWNVSWDGCLELPSLTHVEAALLAL